MLSDLHNTDIITTYIIIYIHIYDTYPLNYVVSETMQGGSTKVYKKGYQGGNPW